MQAGALHAGRPGVRTCETPRTCGAPKPHPNLKLDADRLMAPHSPTRNNRMRPRVGNPASVQELVFNSVFPDTMSCGLKQ